MSKKTPYTKPLPLHNYWLERDTINEGEQFLERTTEVKATRLEGLGYKVRLALDQTPKFARELYGKRIRKPREKMPEPMFDLDKYNKKETEV